MDYQKEDYEQYEQDPQYQPSDGEGDGLNRDFTYDDYQKRQKKMTKPKKVILLVFVAVIVMGAAAVVIGVVSEYSLEFRKTSSGYVIALEQGGQPEDPPTIPPTLAEPPQEVLMPGDEDCIGTGTELMLAEETEAVNPVLTLPAIYEQVIGSVVSISTQTSTGTSGGTGIIMSEDGYIITNYHVIAGAISLEVTDWDNVTYQGVLVGDDDTSDLAVLKIDATGLTPAEFGSSQDVKVGDTVVAIGDPLGKELRGTMTDGIISAINRDLNINGREMTLMQTNAALNNGNSGGPLINQQGQVIGINTMKMSAYTQSASVEGLGFAIPIDQAKQIVDQLIEQGYVEGRPALGITGETLPPMAQTYYDLPSGVFVASVLEGSSAWDMGVEVGDVIFGIEGVAVRSMEEMNYIKNQFEAGDVVTLSVFRNGLEFQVDVQLMDRGAV